MNHRLIVLFELLIFTAIALTSIFLSGCDTSVSDSETAPHLNGTQTEDIITLNILVSGSEDAGGYISMSTEITNEDEERVEVMLECLMNQYCIFQVPRHSSILVETHAESGSFVISDSSECDFSAESSCTFDATVSKVIRFHIQTDDYDTQDASHAETPDRISSHAEIENGILIPQRTSKSGATTLRYTLDTTAERD